LKILRVSLLSSIYVYVSLFLEHEIDGETLAMMDNIEKIAKLVPKFKQQLLFLKEREKLFTVNDDHLNAVIDSSSFTTSNSSFSSPIKSLNNLSTNDDMNEQVSREALTEQDMNLSFPDEYIIPTLPNALLHDIETCALHKFAPHHGNRQILIDTIYHDLIEKYNLL